MEAYENAYKDGFYVRRVIFKLYQMRLIYDF